MLSFLAETAEQICGCVAILLYFCRETFANMETRPEGHTGKSHSSDLLKIKYVRQIRFDRNVLSFLFKHYDKISFSAHILSH
jgi:hypothetical protein